MQMYKRLLSGILALLLAVSLLPMASVPAAAEDEDEDDLRLPRTPVICLGGFGMELYANEDTSEEYPVLDRAASNDSLRAALNETLLEGLRNPLRVLCSPNRLADALAAFVINWLGVLACDEKGESIYPVTRSNHDYRWPQALRWYYDFRFDWRLDPMQTARELDQFIQRVKEETGHSKVNLNALSFGGTICLAYLELFGTGDLESLFLFQSAHGGLIFAEELAQKKFAVNREGLAAFLTQMIPEQAKRFQTLQRLGLFWAGLPVINLLLRCIQDRVYEKAIVPLLAQMPATWALIADDESYQTAKKLLLADAKYADFIKTIDEYHNRVALRSGEILQQAADEIKLALICGYGLTPIPIGENCGYQSDFMVSTARASSGAVCADYGKTLPEDYTQAVPAPRSYLSPDRVIDASPCALRDQTWFVKDYEHQYEFGGAGMYYWFLNHTGQPTVWEDETFPQFR